MAKLLIDESPLQVCPTLATWLGLNEAIFVQQLHYILTQNRAVGKTADGRRWYRDKPSDFVDKYFPFWDEGVVKRAIANLRKDSILLARSDLNKDPKDRSLWYSINYPAIDRLNGPVKRLMQKYDARKAARQARDDTKVQNVPLSETEEKPPEKETKVQNIPQDKSTKCTNDPGTKCTFASVQNVPTPKELHGPKELLLPEDKLPNGNGANAPPAEKSKKPGIRTRIRDVFLEKTNLKMPKKKSDEGFWWSNFTEIADIADQDPDRAEQLIIQVVKYMIAERLNISGPQSIVNLCRTAASGQQLNGVKTNGSNRTKGRDNPIKKRFNLATGEEYWFDTRTNERVPAPG